MYVAAQMAGGACAGFAASIGAVRSGSDLTSESVRAELAREAEIPGAIAGALAGALALGLVVPFLFGASARDPREIGWSSGRPRDLARAAFAGMTVAILCQGSLPLLVPPDPEVEPGPLARMAAADVGTQLVLLLLVLGVAPPAEELLFRGVLLAGLRRSFGLATAGALSTALFVALHASEVAKWWPAAVGITAIGALGLMLRLRHGALGPAISAHVGYNLALAGLVLIALRAGQGASP